MRKILALLIVLGFAGVAIGEETYPKYMATTGNYSLPMGFGSLYATEFTISGAFSFWFDTSEVITPVGSSVQSYIRGMRMTCLGLSSTGTGKLGIKAGAGTSGSAARIIQGDAIVATSLKPAENFLLDMGSVTGATVFGTVTDPNCHCFLEVYRR